MRSLLTTRLRSVLAVGVTAAAVATTAAVTHDALAAEEPSDLQFSRGVATTSGTGDFLGTAVYCGPGKTPFGVSARIEPPDAGAALTRFDMGAAAGVTASLIDPATAGREWTLIVTASCVNRQLQSVFTPLGGTRTEASAECPSGTTFLGAAYANSKVRVRRLGPVGTTGAQLTVEPLADGWSAHVQASCVAEALTTTTATAADSRLDAGHRRTVEARCPAGTAYSGGFELDPQAAALTELTFDGATARATATSLTGSDDFAVQVWATCVG